MLAVFFVHTGARVGHTQHGHLPGHIGVHTNLHLDGGVRLGG